MFIIPVHSFSSLITNSSSETFVCSTDKTVEAVKAILQSILDKYNAGISDRKQKEIEEYGHAYSRVYTFAECFGDIYVSPVSFDFSGTSDCWVKKDPTDEWSCSCPLNELDPDFERLENEHTDWVDRVFKNWNSCSYTYTSRRKFLHRNRKRRMTTWGIINSHRRKIFKDFYAKWQAHDSAIITKNFADNGLDVNDFFVAPKGSSWYYRRNSVSPDLVFNEEKDATITKAYNFSFYWHQKLNKGDIIVTSADDNSVPYELLDEINSVLNARNVHCG